MNTMSNIKIEETKIGTEYTFSVNIENDFSIDYIIEMDTTASNVDFICVSVYKTQDMSTNAFQKNFASEDNAEAFIYNYIGKQRKTYLK